MRRLFLFEFKSTMKSLIIWTLSISSVILLVMIVFGSMEEQMADTAAIFESLGAFSDAFGLNRLNMGTPIGFYGIEAGTILGLGGAMFAAMSGITSLSKEEANHTSEFLFAHPVRRIDVLITKLLSLLLSIVLFHLIITLVGIVSFLLIGAQLPFVDFLNFQLAQLLLSQQIGILCFGLSAFLRRQNYGPAIGLVLILYFLNILYNIRSNFDILKYVTPFAYADAALILADQSVEFGWIFTGLLISLLILFFGTVYFTRKDLQS